MSSQKLKSYIFKLLKYFENDITLIGYHNRYQTEYEVELSSEMIHHLNFQESSNSMIRSVGIGKIGEVLDDLKLNHQDEFISLAQFLLDKDSSCCGIIQNNRYRIKIQSTSRGISVKSFMKPSMFSSTNIIVSPEIFEVDETYFLLSDMIVLPKMNADFIDETNQVIENFFERINQ